MELLVKPLQLGEGGIADEYETLVANFPNLVIVDLDRTTMRRAAGLRARYRLRAIDALQIASCQQHGATAFLTNDLVLRRVTEIDVLLLGDFLDG